MTGTIYGKWSVDDILVMLDFLKDNKSLDFIANRCNRSFVDVADTLGLLFYKLTYGNEKDLKEVSEILQIDFEEKKTTEELSTILKISEDLIVGLIDLQKEYIDPNQKLVSLISKKKK